MKKIVKTIILIVVIILIEIFIFNFRYFELKLSRLEEKEIPITSENIKSEEYKDNRYVKEIEIPIDEITKGIQINLNTKSKKNVVISTSFVDESAKYETKELDDIVYNNKFKNSEYVVLNSNLKCQKINLKITSYLKTNVDSIKINTWYFNFNIIRVVLMFLLIVLLKNLKNINDFLEKNKTRKNITYGILLGVIGILYIIYAIQYPKYIKEEALIENRVYSDPYKLLTQSLTEGRVDIEFPEVYKQELSQLENYKDYSQRDKSKILYLFDFAFYQGNYYCYYGIVPVLTIMLPIKILFNIYVTSNIPCIVYGIGMIVLMLLIYKKILKKFDIKMKFLVEVLGFITLLLVAGIPIIMTFADFYNLVYMSAIFWRLLSTLLIFNLENGKKIKLKLFLIGIFYGLMVCSRPIFALYFVLLLLGVWKYIIDNKKLKVKNILALCIPIIIIAIAQMVYNYVRFDNVFEFGQFYQLTINNPEEQKFNIGMSIEGILAYLFNPPGFTTSYPFIYVSTPSVNNGNIIFVSAICGIFWIPYLWIIFNFKSLKENKKLKTIAIIIIIMTIVILTIDTCLAGINQRYMEDIQVAIAILAFVMWLIYLKKNQDRKYSYRIVCILTIVITTLIMIERMSFMNLGPISGEINGDYKEKGVTQYYLEKMITFYK